MVGNPKTLYDLRSIEAGVQATCRDCGRVRQLDRERLITDLLRRRRPLSWDTLPAQLRCGCGSKRVHLIPMPFCGRPGDVDALVDRLVAAADRLVAALVQTSSNAAALREISDASLEFEQAKRALLAWPATRRDGPG